MGLVSYLFLLFINSTVFVKCVLVILISLFFLSLSFIILKFRDILRYEKEILIFSKNFDNKNINLKEFYDTLSLQKEKIFGMSKIFYSGFKEFVYLHKKGIFDVTIIAESVKIVMIISMQKEMQKLRKHLYTFLLLNYLLLYIGLFCFMCSIFLFFQQSNVNFYHQLSFSVMAGALNESILPIFVSFVIAFPINIVYYKYLDFVFKISIFYKIFINEFIVLVHHKLYN